MCGYVLEIFLRSEPDFLCGGKGLVIALELGPNEGSAPEVSQRPEEAVFAAVLELAPGFFFGAQVVERGVGGVLEGFDVCGEVGRPSRCIFGKEV